MRITEDYLLRELKIMAGYLGKEVWESKLDYPANQDLSHYLELSSYSPNGIYRMYRVESLGGTTPLGVYYHRRSELYYILLAVNAALELQQERVKQQMLRSMVELGAYGTPIIEGGSHETIGSTKAEQLQGTKGESLDNAGVLSDGYRAD